MISFVLVPFIAFLLCFPLLFPLFSVLFIWCVLFIMWHYLRDLSMLFADLLLRGVQSYYLRTLKLQKMSIHSYKHINWRTHNKLEKTNWNILRFKTRFCFGYIVLTFLGLFTHICLWSSFSITTLLSIHNLSLFRRAITKRLMYVWVKHMVRNK